LLLQLAPLDFRLDFATLRPQLVRDMSSLGLRSGILLGQMCPFVLQFGALPLDLGPLVFEFLTLGSQGVFRGYRRFEALLRFGSLPSDRFPRGGQFLALSRQLARFVRQSSRLAVNIGAKLFRVGLGLADLGEERLQMLGDLRFELPEALPLPLDIIVPPPALLAQPSGDVVDNRRGQRRFGDVFFHGVSGNATPAAPPFLKAARGRSAAGPFAQSVRRPLRGYTSWA
jgi:hypothetical protein